MPIVPRTMTDLIEWATAHATEWETAAASIGLSPAQADAFRDAAAEARDAVRAAELAENARRAATLTAQSRIADLRAAASGTLAIIKAFADQQANAVSVYSAAHIPAPQQGSPIPAPGTPTQFTSELLSTGALVLNWKCKNPSTARGTLYEIRRSLNGSSNYQILGTVGERFFTDRTIPAGSSRVDYLITAVRSTRRGVSGMFTVNFGVESRAGNAKIAA